MKKQTGLYAGKSGAISNLRKILTGGAKGHDMYGRDFPAVQLRDVSQLRHVREMPLGNGHGRFFNFAGPYRAYAAAGGRKRKYADAVKQAA